MEYTECPYPILFWIPTEHCRQDDIIEMPKIMELAWPMSDGAFQCFQDGVLLLNIEDKNVVPLYDRRNGKARPHIQRLFIDTNSSLW